MSAVVAPLVIGVTGHRNLSAREVGPLRERVRDFFTQLQREFPGLPLVLLDSLAAGADQLVAQEALAAGARVIAPLPLAYERYLEDFAGAERVAFEALCARAEIVQLPLVPGNTDADVALHGRARDQQYAQAGVFIASHCHILLALWDGRKSDRLGGTGQVVGYLLDGSMPGWIEHGRSHRVSLDSGDESLLYHLACSRQDENGESTPPLPPLQPLQARWISDVHEGAAAAGMPEGFRRMFANMQQFNADAARYADEIQPPPTAHGNASAPADGTALDHLFSAADVLAIHFQAQVLRAMRGLYVLAALMGIAFVCYSDLPSDLPYVGDAIYVFVALFGAGVYLARLARQRGWHRKYIDYRALAEGLRVQGYWRRAGVGADDPGAFAHDNFMQKQDVELGWIRNVMRAAAIEAAARSHAGDGVTTVIAEWIGEPQGEGQLGYYTRKTQQRTRAHHHTQNLSRALLIVVIAASLLLAVCRRWIDPDTTTSVVALMGVLAIIAAARESYAYRKADKELIKQYRYMGGIFAGARRKLDVAPNPDDQRDVLRALGELALAEHAQWALMHRERPLEHGKL